MRAKSLAIGLAVAAVVLGGGTWLIAKGSGDNGAVLQPVTLAQGSITQKVFASGTVETWQTVALSFPSGGRLADVLVQRGDTVQTGQILATQDQLPLQAAANAAAATLSAAQAKLSGLISPSPADLSTVAVDLSNAQKAYADAQAAYQDGMTTARSGLDKAQAAYTSAQKALSNDQTLLAQTENLTGWAGNQPVLTPTVVQAMNLVASNQANLAAAQTALQQAQDAVQNPVALQTVVDQAKEALDAAQNADSLAVAPPADAVTAAQSAVQAAQAAYQGAEYALENGALTAPFAGAVTSSPFKAGETVAAGTPVVALAGDGSSLKVVAQADETQVDKLRIGQKAEVTSGDLPGAVFPGKVVRIAPQAVEVNGVTIFPVDVAVSGAGLRPGMDADVTFPVVATHALYLPKAYVQKHENRRGVCVLLASAGPHFLEVATGLSDSHNLQISSPLLRPGETILPKGRCNFAW